jgi:hypothetical protein
MYIQISSSSSSFTVDRCIYTQCKSKWGGALFLSSSALYIYISRTRFESNSATSAGYDIYVYNLPCFNVAENGTLDSSVCSTTSLNYRIYCYNNESKDSDTSQLKNTCPKEVVWECFFVSFFYISLRMEKRKKKRKK